MFRCAYTQKTVYIPIADGIKFNALYLMYFFSSSFSQRSVCHFDFFFIFIPLWCACVHFIHVRCSSSIVHKMNEKNVEFYIRFVRFAIYFAFSSTIILYIFNKIAFALRLLMVAEQTPSFYPETNLFIFTLENGWCIQYITLELSVQI